MTGLTGRESTRRLKGVCARGTNGADSGNRECRGPEGWWSGEASLGRWHLSKELKEVREQILWRLGTEHPQLKDGQGRSGPA